MRIAHVITRLILGGAQENTLLTCEDLLRRHGDQVLLVTGPALGPEGSLIQRARAGGVPLVVVNPLRRAIHPWRDLAAYRQIKQTLRDFRPDVVHTHSAKAGVLGRAAAWSLGVPAVVHTVHGAPFHPYQGRGARALFRGCERWAARRCHALISVADAMTDLMVDAGVAPRDRFTTIYSGMEVEPLLAADVHRAEVRASLGYTEDHVVVGKIARLFHLKGHEFLVRAAREVVDRHPNVRFLLIGDGLLTDRIRRQIAREGLREHFHLTGLVPAERIPELIAAIDVGVHVSLREGLPRAAVQMLLGGKPVVSYAIDGAPEVVVPEETGLLVPPKSVGKLAAAVDRLVGDRALRSRLGAEGRRRFAEQFDHRRMTIAIRGVYAGLLG